MLVFLLFLAIAGPMVAINRQMLYQAARTAQLEAQRARAAAEDNAEALRRQNYFANMDRARDSWERETVDDMVPLLKQYVPQPGTEDLRGFEWYYLWRLARPAISARTLEHGISGDIVSDVVFSRDGNVLTTLSGRSIKRWDTRSGKLLYQLSFEAQDTTRTALRCRLTDAWPHLVMRTAR